MKILAKKSCTVVLAAVLLFMACFPIPTGAAAFDKIRYKDAEAIPAVAVPVIVGSAALAAGVCIVGFTQADYEANLSSFVSGFEQLGATYSERWNDYVTEKGSFDAAMLSAVDINGNISLQTLTNAGFYDGLHSYMAYCVDGGSAVVGDSSLINYSGSIAPYGVTCYIGYPDLDSLGITYNYPGHENYYVIGGWLSSQGTWTILYGNVNSTFTPFNNSNGNGYEFGYVTGYQYRYSGESWSSVWWGYANTRSAKGTNTSLFFANPAVTAVRRQLGDDFTSTVATASQSFLDESFGSVASIEPFTPTAEQLSTGYSAADIVDAITGSSETTNANLSAIASQVSSIVTTLAPVAGIATNVQSINDLWTSAATATSTPFPWLDAIWNTLTGWWQQLLDFIGTTPLAQLLAPLVSAAAAVVSWIGSTPFGTVIGDLKDAVLGIPDVFSRGIDTILGYLQALLAALQALGMDIVHELGLDALFDAVLGMLDGILDAVGGFFGRFRMPDGWEGSGGGSLAWTDFSGSGGGKFDVSDKVPFCYLVRSQAAIGSMFNNFSGNRSFYFDLEIPYGGTVRFDGEPVLSQNMGGLDIATTIRVLATGFLCLGLLYRAYKIVERNSGGI